MRKMQGKRNYDNSDNTQDWLAEEKTLALACVGFLLKSLSMFTWQVSTCTYTQCKYDNSDNTHGWLAGETTLMAWNLAELGGGCTGAGAGG